MRLLVVAVGTRQPAWIDAGFEEYAARMPREARIELVEIKAEKRASGRTVSQLLAQESARIRAALPRACRVVALDERGEMLTTLEFARRLAGWMAGGTDVAFLVGSADGLDPLLKEGAELRLGLSAMTLPHGLARVLLAEQLYRAVSALHNHPYHRE